MVYSNNLGQSRVGIRNLVVNAVNSVDADAIAFIAAAGITNSTQAAAINTLVNDLKTYGLWTKMKALYPFVGGTATSHKFNLKDPRDDNAAYRLVFNGGWTHSSTGALPNGTTGYADTKLIPSSILTASNLHISYYSRTDSVKPGMMGLQDDSVSNGSQLYLQGDKTTDYYSATNTDTNRILVSSTNTTGYYIASRLTSTNLKAYKNGSQVGSNIQISSGYRANISMYLGGFNYKNQYSVFTIDYGNKESTFASIGDGLTDTEAANFYTAVQTYQSTLGRNVGTPIVADADAQAFLNAAAITDLGQANAVNTLVTDLKAANIWTKMKALYPMVGGTVTSHKFNLKDPRDDNAAYRLVFNGGWTHSSTGAKPNGTNGYADTFLTPSTSLQQNSVHISYYSRTNMSHYGIDFGVYAITPQSCLYGVIKDTDGKCYFRVNRNASIPESSQAMTSASIFFMLNRVAGYSGESLFVNNTKTSFGQTSTGLSNYKIPLGALSNAGTYQSYSIRESAFASIGDGLTDTEATNFYNSVQKFQTTLGRQIGSPIVSDTDAQAFINAAGLTDLGQANAVNTLVVDLKAANIWTKMKALYPMVGGTATSHKFNLKDPRDDNAAYRLVFNGGWTHSSTGALPNGTTGYANSFLAPNAMGQNNIHVSFYSRTDVNTLSADIGAGSGSSFVEIIPRYIGNGYVYVNTSQGDYFANPSSTGLYIANRIVASTVSLFKNNTKVINGARAAQTPSTYNLYLSAENGAGITSLYSPREQAFASIGDGLTDAEAANLYTAVQKYQTSLGRQV